MNQLFTPAAAVAALLAAACQTMDRETEIAVDQVPAAVLAAAQKKVPGLVVEVACKEVEGGVLVYCLEGEAGGKDWEVDVTADGKVLEAEELEDEDGDEDDDEDEEEDEDDD
jgi:hypothetical protein